MTVPAASGEPPALRDALKGEAERHGTALPCVARAQTSPSRAPGLAPDSLQITAPVIASALLTPFLYFLVFARSNSHP